MCLRWVFLSVSLYICPCTPARFTFLSVSLDIYIPLVSAVFPNFSLLRGAQELGKVCKAKNCAKSKKLV